MEEVEREYEELPEWKKTSAEQFLQFSSDDEEQASSIREPRQVEEYR
jgi:hypothetical protein